ncbi:MAG: hypothetical protein AAFO69_12850, partial [Bacteroidota bacterium]
IDGVMTAFPHCLSHRQWFADTDPDKWFASWGTPKASAEHQVLEEHKSWSHRNDITYTPATILQGHLFPKEYELTDLIYFLEEFSEQVRPAEEQEAPIV